jgi:hypothetical protein
VKPCISCPKKIRPSGSAWMKTTGQTIISGMGELHLDVLVDRMLREFRVQANVGRPRWLIVKRFPARSQYQLPLHQADWWARPVWACRVQDGAARAGVVESFSKTKSWAVIPREYIPAIEKGVIRSCRGWYSGRLPNDRLESDPHTMALTTKLIQVKWLSKWLPSLHSKKAQKKVLRYF